MVLTIIEKIILLLFLTYAAFSDEISQHLNLVPMILAFICGTVLQLIIGDFKIYELALGCAVGVVLLIIAKLSHQALGYGDALLFVASGPFLGVVENVFLLLYSLIFASLFSIILIIFRKRKLKDNVPFAPFILGGYICVLAMA